MKLFLLLSANRYHEDIKHDFVNSVITTGLPISRKTKKKKIRFDGDVSTRKRKIACTNVLASNSKFRQKN